jgi:hypothetical protein
MEINLRAFPAYGDAELRIDAWMLEHNRREVGRS